MHRATRYMLDVLHVRPVLHDDDNCGLNIVRKFLTDTRLNEVFPRSWVVAMPVYS
jgi:hypothetical protein